MGLLAPHLYRVAKHAPSSYWVRKEKVGRKFRILRTPTGELRRVQDVLHDAVLRHLPCSDAASCAPGRGVVMNARAHLGQPYVTLLDFADCFPSVRVGLVTAALQASGFDQSAAELVTRLCTVSGELPQGAPTSPTLLNVVLAPFDRAIAREAERLGCRYTRYADDVCLSGPVPLERLARTATRSARRFGFRINEAKRRVWGPGGPPPSVTGIVLTHTLRPQPEFLRALAYALWRARRDGVGLTRAQIEGRIAWVTQVDPRLGARLRRRLGRLGKGTAPRQEPVFSAMAGE
jgi:RNA-directed DNA polymerase